MEVIQRSKSYLEQKGVESARLQVELLLAHTLKMPRLQLYLNFDRVLTLEETAQARHFVQCRGQHIPLQQILGSTSFCGLELSVTSDVLCPRPETEVLAERGWQWLNQCSWPDATRPQVLDFGTGSGCLAIALAIKCPPAKITALEVSPAALAVARANAARHQVMDRLEFILGHRLSAVAPGTLFDLIISNPPYIPSAVIPTLPLEVRDHEPCVALDGGPDGLDFYRRLAADAPAWLQPGGRMMLEFGDGQEDALDVLFGRPLWQVLSIENDNNARPRVLTVARA